MELLASNYSSSESGSGSGSESESDSASEVALVEEAKSEKTNTLSPLPTSIIEKYHLRPDNIMKPLRTTAKNWSTFIYLEWRPTSAERSLLSKMIMSLNKACQDADLSAARRLSFHPLHLSALGSPLPLHISLSQNVTFVNEQQRDRLYAIISKKIKQSKIIEPFRVKFEPKYQLLASNRTNVVFLTLPLTSEVKRNEISNICAAITDAFKDVFPNFTDAELQNISINTEFAHLSIAQAVNVPQSTTQYLPLLQSHIPTRNRFEPIEFNISSIKYDKNREVLNIPI
ncbi:hypothetical protein HG535_0G03810 [Zygotorulaspora mrakii]|uniref:U6 snRNA phosphodiesterase 1 n=1 Tax=Zygotorulaspora mrakii TaxID=42260 RepID=A0A7H9B6Z4_ZYGMR|nr:uncharacterized protein HG535_0G03810 [Zygotorulaspora mrakii]QLG74498.1 hypothetical protein HG535_0G03810 [Zygotorulaspora mrakii]